MSTKDVYAEVTEKVVAKLEQGIIPWRKMWTTEKPYNNTSDKDYNILNCLLLEKGGAWDTFFGWSNNNAKIKKGEKASYIVQSWKSVFDKDGKFINGKLASAILANAKYRIGKTTYNGEEYNIGWYLKWVPVFHSEQVEPKVEGETVKIKRAVTKKKATKKADIDKAIKKYTKRENIKVTEGSNEAFYSISDDSITVPDASQYEIIEAYYSTVFHELVHSTGAEKRLNRNIKNAFGTEKYAKEELIAELGSAFILNTLGLETEETFDNSAAYLQSWLKALKDDTKLIYYACAGAEKASNYILA